MTDDVCLLHSCDNPPCVNPNHLYIGDRADNVRDKVERGRLRIGEDAGMAKLTEAQARRILSLKPAQYPRRTIGLAKQLASEHNICMGAVHAIWRRHSWKHLNEFGDREKP